MQLYVIEGNTQMLDGGAMFGNAPKMLWEQWIKPDAKNRIPMACRCLLLLADDGKRVLFETGIGNFFEPGMKERYGVVEDRHCLLDNLGKHGLGHADIDYLVLSHLHFDHAGGLMDSFAEGRDPQLLFPNARFVVGKKQWQHANHPHLRDRASFLPHLNRMLAASGRLVLVDEESRPDIVAGVRFHFSDGHTPGLLMSEIALADGPLLFCSDLVPGRYWVHLPICMGYDRYPEHLIDEKQLLLQNLLGRNGRLFFTHDIDLPCGWVRQDERQRFYVEPSDL